MWISLITLNETVKDFYVVWKRSVAASKSSKSGGSHNQTLKGSAQVPDSIDKRRASAALSPMIKEDELA